MHKGFNPCSIKDALHSLHADFNKDKFVHCMNEKPEGLVYRVERKGKVDFLSKYVRHDFEAGKYLIKEAPPIWNVDIKDYPKNLRITDRS